MNLNERQTLALRWLADLHAAGDDDLIHGRGYAFRLGSRMRRAGMFEGVRHRDTANGEARSAARTLSSLRKRGLATSSTPGGEAFQAVHWQITPAGLDAVNT